MSRLTQLELFKATTRHEPHKDFLYRIDFTPFALDKLLKSTGLPNEQGIVDHFGVYRPLVAGMAEARTPKPTDFQRYFDDMQIPEKAFINHLGVLEIPGSMYHFTEYVSPLRNATTVRELEDFAFPCADLSVTEETRTAVDEAHANGRVVMSYAGHMYEDAWQIRGYEEFLMDMIAQPEICDYIFDKLLERNLNRVRMAAIAGVDFIQCGDDVASQKALMFNIELWRKFIKSRWAQVYAEARRIKPDIKIWYHSDGNIEPIIPELIEIGVDILNPIQPECLDVVKLKKMFGKQLVFEGTIGTQTTMPFGSADDVRALVRERKSTIGFDGALILSPTHTIEPEVPVENVLAFFEAAAERE